MLTRIASTNIDSISAYGRVSRNAYVGSVNGGDGGVFGMLYHPSYYAQGSYPLFCHRRYIFLFV